jgi:hypothetical protein
MDYPFSQPQWLTAAGDRTVITGSIELTAKLEPSPSDPDDWIVAGIDVLDVERDEWFPLNRDSPWWPVFVARLLDEERIAIDSEWIAHRNAEGDAALYGQEA